MKYYEVQGKRIPTMPEGEALLKLRRFPPNAEVITWDGNDIRDVSMVEDKIEEILFYLSAENEDADKSYK